MGCSTGRSGLPMSGSTPSSHRRLDVARRTHRQVHSDSINSRISCLSYSIQLSKMSRAIEPTNADRRSADGLHHARELTAADRPIAKNYSGRADRSAPSGIVVELVFCLHADAELGLRAVSGTCRSPSRAAAKVVPSAGISLHIRDVSFGAVRHRGRDSAPLSTGGPP